MPPSNLYDHLMQVLVNCDEANCDEDELYMLIKHELDHWLLAPTRKG